MFSSVSSASRARPAARAQVGASSSVAGLLPTAAASARQRHGRRSAPIARAGSFGGSGGSFSGGGNGGFGGGGGGGFGGSSGADPGPYMASVIAGFVAAAGLSDADASSSNSKTQNHAASDAAPRREGVWALLFDCEESEEDEGWDSAAAADSDDGEQLLC